MSPTAAAADWIKRIADDERRRDAMRVEQDERAARRADLVQLNGRRLVDELRAAVARDVEAFRQEFVDDRARAITIDAAAADGGFAVRKPGPADVVLTVVPKLEAAAMSCDYRFAQANGLPPRVDRFEVTFASDGDALQMKDLASGQLFATVDALSEFMLVPVFTGRRR